jgi:hypothetical protein
MKESDNSPSATRLSIDSERFPRLAALLSAGDLPLVSPDIWFEEGLSVILDGLRADLAKERANRENI